MCGIIGYTGTRRAERVLLDGLKTLEYRGYDSAGIALAGKELTVYKCAGRVSALAAMAPSSDARAGIGHTRWATNGAPCAENAHPHLSFDGSLAVVHNGVIENCDEISRLLKREGVRMASGTDSEMIAHMLALEKGDIRERIFRVAEKLEGAMTILVLPRGEKRVYCFKRGAALLVAEGKRECFAASDAAALSPYVKEARALKDGECAVLSPKGAEFFSREGAAPPSPLIPVALSPALGHDCHMREEISEIPRALISTYRSFASRFPEREEVVARLKRSSRILLAGCGTAYHACLYGERLTEELCGIPCRALPAGEPCPSLFAGKDSFCVFVTQSGETADTLRAMEGCKRAGAYTLAVTNSPGSSAALQADSALFLRAGREVAVAATKTYCCQLLALWLLAHSAEGTGGEEEKVADLAKKCETALCLPLPDVCDRSKLFFIGRGRDFVTAKEGALKYKEVTWLPADAYSAGELKHGPIALADADSTAIALLTDPAHAARIRAAVSELRSRGTKVCAFTSAGDIGADETYILPSSEECALSPVIAAIPLQRLALECALRMERDPDKPRNLAKSVTVI